MDAHEELELLSAYVDGELDAGDRARLDSHVPACAECRETLQALRATIADLATLPEVAPTEQESWALRSAISRGRLAPARWQRFAWASSAAAAAVIAIVAIVANQGGPATTTALAPKSVEGLSRDSTPAQVYKLDQNFNATSAQNELLAVASSTSTFSALHPNPAPAQGSTPLALSSTESDAVTRQPAPTTPELNHCVDVVRSSTQELLEARQFEIARYEGKDAFLLFFGTTGRIELWVMSKPSCEVLYFAQAKTS